MPHVDHLDPEVLRARLILNSKVNTATGCIEWMGGRTEKGYGSIRVWDRPRGSLKRAHRISYEIHSGPIPDGLQVLHKCDNPPCINPDHLFLGTNRDNRLDSASKGRTNRHLPWVRGEKNVTAKLSWSKVDQVNALSADGLSDATIGAQFGVRPGTINFIRRKITWQKR